MIKHYKNFVHGTWVESSCTDKIEIENPATEEIFATTPSGCIEDAVKALESANRAQKTWAARPAVEREKILMGVADAIRENKDMLVELLVKEQGKPLSLAYGEVEASADFIVFAAGSARRTEGDIFPSDNPNEQIQIRNEPYGVCAGITAWNFPLALACRKVGPALVAGNTMVLKPAQITPLATIEFTKIAFDAGLPAGVLNIISGRGSVVGKELTMNKMTNLVTMTGSVYGGQEIIRQSADTIPAIRLELGGKAPFIIMDDADIDKAVVGSISGRFTNCGQICTCNERMYVHSAIYDEFVEKLVAGVKKLKVGDPMTDVDMGPKVSGPELDKIHEMVKAALKEGATLATGGEKLPMKGHFYAPTVLVDVKQEMQIVHEEIFGPVLPIVKVDSLDEAIEMANDCDYGLSACLFTNRNKDIMTALDRLDFGEVFINRETGEMRQGFHVGHKLSGTGGEDGKYGLANYLRKKTVYINYQ